MKKFAIAIAMFVTIMSVMVIGPEEAFAKSGYVNGVHKEDVETAESIMDYGAILINIASDGEYTVVYQDMGPSPDGTGYDWYITAYNHELKQYEEDMVHIDYDEFEDYLLGLHLAVLYYNY